jgi:uncharacterized protein
MEDCMLALPLIVTLAVAPAIAPEDQALYDQLCTQVESAYDSARGGFVARGRPAESAVELAFARARESGATPWLSQAVTTVQWMRILRDTVGGGFMESAGDADPHSTRFEKRTVSNSQRLESLILAWQATGERRYRQDAVRVVEYFDRVLLDGRGGFVAGQGGDRELVPEVNGPAIHCWLTWGAATGERRFRDFALRSGDRVWETCWADSFGLLRRGTFGQLLKLPQLADQVEMGRAYVLAARLGGRTLDRQRARAIGELLLMRFQDAEKHGFRTQSSPRKDGSPKRAGREPEENARAALFLCELSALTGEPRYREAARRAWQAFTPHFEGAGLEAADWALAIRAVLRPGLPERPAWGSVAHRAPIKRRASRYRTGAR